MEEKKIGSIKNELAELSVLELPDFIQIYSNDERAGVQKLVVSAQKKLDKYYAELERIELLK